MALAGGLSRAGWPQDMVAEFIGAVASAAGDTELADRARAAESTAGRLAKGQEATGWNRLAKIIGANVVERATKWLEVTVVSGIKSSTPTSGTRKTGKTLPSNNTCGLGRRRRAVS